MKFVFLSRMVPFFLSDDYRRNCKNNMQDAAIALQNHIYEGLCSNLKVKIPILNILPISSFPQYYKKAFVPHKKVFNEEQYIENVGFCNIKWIRNYSIQKRLYKSLYAWFSNHREPTTVFVYTLTPFFLKPLSDIKNIFKNVKVCAIVADLPDMMSLKRNRSVFEKTFSYFLTKHSYSLINQVDSFVLLTKQMADYMGIQQPFCVMEGISTFFPLRQQNGKSGKGGGKKIIFYAGTLHERFGVKNLVKAFELIEDDAFELVICGAGDCADYINMVSKKNSRVRFLGQQPREKILELMSDAAVLVNPRQNNEAFTKYSFPSKNLEYLSSGIPFVAYKLDGIPDEYDEYINYVEDDSLQSLKNKIKDVALDVHGLYKKKSDQAASFVKTFKSAIPQTKKIIDLCMV